MMSQAKERAGIWKNWPDWRDMARVYQPSGRCMYTITSTLLRYEGPVIEAVAQANHDIGGKWIDPSQYVDGHNFIKGIPFIQAGALVGYLSRIVGVPLSLPTSEEIIRAANQGRLHPAQNLIDNEYLSWNDEIVLFDALKRGVLGAQKLVLECVKSISSSDPPLYIRHPGFEIRGKEFKFSWKKETALVKRAFFLTGTTECDHPYMSRLYQEDESHNYKEFLSEHANACIVHTRPEYYPSYSIAFDGKGNIHLIPLEESHKGIDQLVKDIGIRVVVPCTG